MRIARLSADTTEIRMKEGANAFPSPDLSRLRAALPRGSVVSLEGSPGITSVVRVALRYDLRLAGIRAALPGMGSRWGPWYRLDGRRYAYGVYLTDVRTATVPRGGVVASVRFRYGPAAYGIATSVWPVRPPA